MSAADTHLSDRAAKALKIIAQPAKYKVCESCDSIVGAHVSICPNCSGYRYEEAPEAVVRQAELLASRAQTSVIAEDLL